MKTILIIGSGAREHALAWRLAQEGTKLHVAPGNGGTSAIATNHSISVDDYRSNRRSRTVPTG